MKNKKHYAFRRYAMTRNIKPVLIAFLLYGFHPVLAGRNLLLFIYRRSNAGLLSFCPYGTSWIHKTFAVVKILYKSRTFWRYLCIQ